MEPFGLYMQDYRVLSPLPPGRGPVGELKTGTAWRQGDNPT